MPIKMTGSVKPTSLTSPDPVSMPIVQKLPALKANIENVRDYGPSGTPPVAIKKVVIYAESSATQYSTPALGGLRFFDATGALFDTQYANRTTSNASTFISPAITLTSDSTYASVGSYYPGYLFQPATQDDAWSCWSPSGGFFWLGLRDSISATLTATFTTPMFLSKIDLLDYGQARYDRGTGDILNLSAYDADDNLVYQRNEGPARTPVSNVPPYTDRVVYNIT